MKAVDMKSDPDEQIWFNPNGEAKYKLLILHLHQRNDLPYG